MKTILRIWIVAIVVLCAMMPARIEYVGKARAGVVPAMSEPAWSEQSYFTEIAVVHTAATALALIAPAVALLIFWDAIWQWMVRRRYWIFAIIAIAALALLSMWIVYEYSNRTKISAAEFLDAPSGSNFGGIPIPDPTPAPAGLPTHNAAGQPLIWLDTSDPTVLVPTLPATANQVRPAIPTK